MSRIFRGEEVFSFSFSSATTNNFAIKTDFYFLLYQLLDNFLFKIVINRVFYINKLDQSFNILNNVNEIYNCLYDWISKSG